MSKSKLAIVGLFLLVSCLLVNFSSASYAMLRRKVNDCHDHCVKERGHSAKHCNLYCLHGIVTNKKTLTILEDGVPITESMSESGVSKLDLPKVRFDRALFNTPSAFDEFIELSGSLQKQVSTAAADVFNPRDGLQFHLLSLPIPLNSDQLLNKEFMNRLLDVVPANELVYKETSPLTFSEAYRQFLLDIKVNPDQLNADKSPQTLARIAQMEAQINNDMNSFLTKGDQCYMQYEQHLVANNLKRIAYTFDTYGPTNQNCVQADRHMADHEQHSKELADYLKSLNPYDDLFTNIALQTQQVRHDWNINLDTVRSFTSRNVQAEPSGTNPYNIALNMVKYYLKKEYFGSSSHLEESCVNAHIKLHGLGWQEIDVSPANWYSQQIVDKFRGHATNSGKNYFNAGGFLQRKISKVVIAYKPQLRIVISKAMKDIFIEQSLRRNMRALEFGSMVFDTIEFNGQGGTSMIDSYEMIVRSSTQDPQIIGYKSQSYSPMSVAKVSLDGFAYCRRESACEVRKIPLVPIHRYAATNHHFYTTNFNELGMGGNGWKYENIQGYCHPNQHPGTVPVYRYVGHGKHFYTQNHNELGNGRDGWRLEGILCYVYPNQIAGTVAWHRYAQPRTGDHLYTTAYGEVKTAAEMTNLKGFAAIFGRLLAWNYEGITGYIYQQSTLDQAIACCKCQ